MNILASLENMPITWTEHDKTWEFFDEVTGEIFPIETERGAKMLRSIAIRTDSLPYRFSTVRSNARNEWSTYKYSPFNCHCCGEPLNVEIDPYNICMNCVDMECNVKD